MELEKHSTLCQTLLVLAWMRWLQQDLVLLSTEPKSNKFCPTVSAEGTFLAGDSHEGQGQGLPTDMAAHRFPPAVSPAFLRGLHVAHGLTHDWHLRARLLMETP